MKSYLKLVNFEFNRFFKLYAVLLGITIVSQITGIIVIARGYMKKVDEVVGRGVMPKSEFLEQYGMMSFHNISDALWFVGPIVLSITALLIYVFFIWYRDWIGKNTFSYRLFMLPVARIQIYLAKLTTILVSVLGLVGLQLLLFPIERKLLNSIVPSDFRMEFSVNEMASHRFLMTFFPSTFTEFLIYYGVGIGAVAVIFTAILFERCFRIKGIVYGILFCTVSQFVFLAPLLVNSFILENYFYITELFFLEVAAGILVIAGSIFTANYLLKHKIRI